MAIYKNEPHDSGLTHATGESVFIDDRRLLAGEIFVDLFSSPIAHGRIIKIDLEKAQAIPGVVALYTAKDLPGANMIHNQFSDQSLMAMDHVNFIGEPIVVIAAQNQAVLQQVKKVIKVEFEELPPILSIDEAIKQKQFIGGEYKIARGDLDLGFKQADHVIQGIFENGGQEHFYLEAQSAVVYPGEQGQLEVHSSTQHPTETQHLVAEALGLPFHKVVCIVKRLGGGFGGKESQAAIYAALAALVTHKTGRPARLKLSTDEDMKITGKRHPFKSHYRVGIKKDGTITALSIDFFSNGGAYSDLSIPILQRALFHAENAYYIPHISLTGRCCRTHLPPNTAFRGFGGPQGMAVMENLIEEIALLLKQDALAIRERNCYGIKERNTTPYGQKVENNMLPELFAQLKKSSHYHERKKQINDFNQQSNTHLRGISLTPIKFGISFTSRFLNQGSALVNVQLDGTVQVSTGAIEMGQGVNTKIKQIVAGEFGLTSDKVMVLATSTEKNPNTSPTAASSGADINGNAAVLAAQKIIQRLQSTYLQFLDNPQPPASFEIDPHKKYSEEVVFTNGKVRAPARNQEIDFKKLLEIAYFNRVSLGDVGYYRTPELGFDVQKGQGRAFLYFTQGACCSEVEICRFTGRCRVVRSDLLMDIGKSLSLGVDLGQIKGAFIQGMGWLTSEELRYSQKGELLAFSPTTYKVPNVQDLPEIFNVNLIDNPNSLVSLKQSKAVGEPPFMLALSVWMAIKQALSFVSPGQVPQIKIPATGEEILLNINSLLKK